MHEHLLVGLVILISLGTASQLLAYHARLPSILVLLACGGLVGPGLGLVEPGELLGEILFPLVSLGAALVLFEGGLTARVQDLKEIKRPVGRLISVGLVITWVGTTLAAHYLVGMSWNLAALLGAVLVVTGPTVIGPIIRHARPGGSTGKLLKFEGIINDPIGAVLALIVFEVIQVERTESAALLIFYGVARATLAATVLGMLGSWLYARARHAGWIPAALDNSVLLAVALGTYALSNHIQAEAGLLAVTVMGMALASREDLDIEANVEFAENLRTMLISVLFILLTARIQTEDILGISWGGVLFVAVLIFAVRPLSVFASTWGTSLTFKEKTFLAAMAPRGIVAAAVSSVFALRLADEGYEGAESLLPLTFLVIASCVVIYGLSAKPLVHWLSLDDQPPERVLIVGTNVLARKIALGLQGAGVDTVLVGEDRREVLAARRAGVDAQYGHLRSPVLLDRLDLETVGLMLALTSSDDSNQLAGIQVGRFVGNDNVARVNVIGADAPVSLHHGTDHRGPAFMARSTPLDVLLRKAEDGEVRVTQLTDEFTFDDYCAHHGPQLVPLLIVEEGRAPRLVDADAVPEAGQRILSLTPTS